MSLEAPRQVRSRGSLTRQGCSQRPSARVCGRMWASPSTRRASPPSRRGSASHAAPYTALWPPSALLPASGRLSGRPRLPLAACLAPRAGGARSRVRRVHMLPSGVSPRGARRPALRVPGEPRKQQRHDPLGADILGTGTAAVRAYDLSGPGSLSRRRRSDSLKSAPSPRRGVTEGAKRRGKGQGAGSRVPGGR